MNRDQHLAWAKKRALEYVERGDINGALGSFLSDMSKHEELKDHLALEMGMALLLSGNLRTESQMRTWIEGFN